MIQARTIKPLGFLDDIIDLINGVDNFINDEGNSAVNIDGIFDKITGFYVFFRGDLLVIVQNL